MKRLLGLCAVLFSAWLPAAGLPDSARPWAPSDYRVLLNALQEMPLPPRLDDDTGLVSFDRILAPENLQLIPPASNAEERAWWLQSYAEVLSALRQHYMPVNDRGNQDWTELLERHLLSVFIHITDLQLCHAIASQPAEYWQESRVVSLDVARLKPLCTEALNASPAQLTAVLLAIHFAPEAQQQRALQLLARLTPVIAAELTPAQRRGLLDKLAQHKLKTLITDFDSAESRAAYTAAMQPFNESRKGSPK